jgi:hypothetical protein
LTLFVCICAAIYFTNMQDEQAGSLGHFAAPSQP